MLSREHKHPRPLWQGTDLRTLCKGNYNKTLHGTFPRSLLLQKVILFLSIKSEPHSCKS